MSSSIANDLTKWNDEQLCEHEDDDDELFEKASAECRHHMKVRKEVEHWRTEEVARQEAEEEEKQKVEVEAQRRVEVEAKACAEAELGLGPFQGQAAKGGSEWSGGGCRAGGGPSPMLWMLGYWGIVQDEDGWRCEWPGDTHSTWRRKQEELMLPWAGKKQAWTQSLVVDEDKDGDEEYKEEVDEEAEEECDALCVLTEVLVAVVTEMQDMAMDRRYAAVESHAQMEQMLGILEEIWGCLDPEFAPEESEVGLEEEFAEEEVAQVAKEREALKGQSKEEVEVDKSV
ncbi:hypothetical protein PAXRUDRAFT_14518 [Paxillus rubicundulus Ve08.2h10]|uniref:Uncharacterized protein n=1 Tax=Paxillus rubicundulus Ve08.2h10 TaxID=930991 RepID=A0A0D0DQQ1_9AGAM|nr:hypothetical protein PAXRUDRAFT_14518 [Paxillus rubicundulus Ve08.2h10]